MSQCILCAYLFALTSIKRGSENKGTKCFLSIKLKEKVKLHISKYHSKQHSVWHKNGTQDREFSPEKVKLQEKRI